MRKLIFVFIIFIVFSCNNMTIEQSMTVNIENDTTIVLTKKDWQGIVNGLEIILLTNYNDTIEFYQSNGVNVNYQYFMFEQSEKTIKGDWYADTCFLSFKNVKEPIDNLKINYQFFD